MVTTAKRKKAIRRMHSRSSTLPSVPAADLPPGRRTNSARSAALAFGARNASSATLSIPLTSFFVCSICGYAFDQAAAKGGKKKSKDDDDDYYDNDDDDDFQPNNLY